MNHILKKLIRSGFHALDLDIERKGVLDKLRLNERAGDDLAVLHALPNEQTPEILRNLKSSKSQLRQDLFVLSHCSFKRDGYFVEFGATNGVDWSNTHLMEKDFGWKGILAEPACCWHESLRTNRKAHVETDCIWSESNATLSFNEVSVGELSTISAFGHDDLYGKTRMRGKKYDVRTISLNDLLAKYEAPRNIDYLSIDTEGSEFEILRRVDFDNYSFEVISCEHNFTQMRENIYTLLTGNGYIRKYENLSKFDDWYIRAH